MVIERKGGRTFSSPGPIKSKLCVFVLQVQLGALQPAHSSSLLLFFSSLFCFFLFFSWFFFSSFMVLFACLLVNAVCFWMGAVDTERMRILEEQALKVVFSSGPGLF